MLKTKPTQGVRGILIRTATEPGYMFRVYHKDGTMDFTDYDILHYDLEIEILEDEIGRAHV